MKKFATIAFLFLTCFLVASTVAQADVILYGVKQNTSNIYEINVTAGTETLLAVTGITPIGASTPNGVGYDARNNRIYLATSGKLYFWDGTATVFAGNITGNPTDGTFYQGKIYYIAANTDDLYIVPFLSDGTIDYVTGISKVDITGNTKTFAFGDIDIRADGILFGTGRANSAIVF